MISTGGGDGSPPDQRSISAAASCCQVSTTVSGFSEIDTMPSCGQPVGEVGWSLGPWPQMPMYLPRARQAAIARAISALTAGSRSSKSAASSSRPESRSRPSVSWVRSFEPIGHAVEELQVVLGQDGVARDLAHHDQAQARSGRARPCSASMSTTRSACSRVRTKGTMISTLVRPMSLRTRLSARTPSREGLAELLC